jgi:hypothetical protein
MRKHLGKRPSPSMVVALLALFLAGGAGYAATGGSFILGQANTATSPSSLTAPINDRALKLTNMNTGTGASALGLNVAPGHAPFLVQSTSGKVLNLNADKLDGLDSSAFLRTTGKAADANLLDGMDSAAFRNPATALAMTSDTIPPQPPFTFSNVADGHTLTTVTAGKVFVFGRASFGSPCQAGGANCFIRAGLYVDDLPVAGSGAVVTAAAGSRVSWQFISFGVAENVPAGVHTLRIVVRFIAGSPGDGTSTGNSMIGGISVG